MSKICPETPLSKLLDSIDKILNGGIHYPTLFLAIITFIAITVLYKVKDRLKGYTGLRHLPVILIVVVVSVFFSWSFDFSANNIKVVGHVTVGLVRPSLPPDYFQVFQLSVRPALAIAAIIFIKSVVVAKEQAVYFGYNVHPDQVIKAFIPIRVPGSFSAIFCFALLLYIYATTIHLHIHIHIHIYNIITGVTSYGPC